MCSARVSLRIKSCGESGAFLCCFSFRLVFSYAFRSFSRHLVCASNLWSLGPKVKRDASNPCGETVSLRNVEERRTLFFAHHAFLHPPFQNAWSHRLLGAAGRYGSARPRPCKTSNSVPSCVRTLVCKAPLCSLVVPRSHRKWRLRKPAMLPHLFPDS